MIPVDIVQTFFTKRTQHHIQYLYVKPKDHKPTLCFIPGFQSDFITSKKSHLVYQLCKRHEFGFLSWNHSVLDSETSIFDWYNDGIDLLSEFHIDYIVCASMGLWISLLMSTNMKIRGVLSIGGAIDVTEKWLSEIPSDRKNEIKVYKRPSTYDPSGYYDIPMHFLIESRKACLQIKDNGINYDKAIPIYMLHGQKDVDCSIEDARLIKEFLVRNQQKNVRFYEIEDGDHRLSKPAELRFIEQKIIDMISKN
ncbi:hypothetical protein BDF20DRAFT_914830 [Mycotypha africana]|uniref:uncharacterized protein n=1 Tax=Mycotypha africana TaxID=64632 RepID=UPI0022FFCD62|nr:uncharacterized protein BDF20DRAFT_914830 [Mycotypha africana]KAI8973378.1 hypothetical protein BDF20DRAFT_914830 [Mycotypha africana]